MGFIRFAGLLRRRSSDWSGGAVPGGGDDVTLNASGAPTIQLASGLQGVHSLTTSDPLKLTGGLLSVGTIQNTANITLAGGTISGATINESAGATVMATSTESRLTGVTINGNLDLSADNAAVHVNGGLTLNGTAIMSANNDRLAFDGPSPQTLGGNATILFQGTNGTRYLAIESGAALTIGPNVLIHGQRGIIGQAVFNGGPHSLVNQGTITADAADPGNGIQISDQVALVNAGTIQALNGGGVTLRRLGSNSGTISAAAASSVSGGGSGGSGDANSGDPNAKIGPIGFGSQGFIAANHVFPYHTYGFYSSATDNVGNVQATPASAQATTHIGQLTGGPSVTYDPLSNTATFQFATILPDGNYKATLPAGAISDSSGNHLAADYTASFFFLTGDINHDRSVGFADLVILARNYGHTLKAPAAAVAAVLPTVDAQQAVSLAASQPADVSGLPRRRPIVRRQAVAEELFSQQLIH